MIAASGDVATSTVDLHAQFLELLLPKIETHARIYFRDVKCPARRADLIDETVALAWKWYRRLVERGKDVMQFAMVFVYLVAKAVKCGQRTTGRENINDVMNPLAQKRHGFQVEPLPISTCTSHDTLYGAGTGQRQLDEYEERLRDNTITPPPDQAAFRIDWPRFLKTLTHRDRELAQYLSLGHRPSRAAAKFGLVPGRVTQLRQRWRREWRSFGGDDYFEKRRQAGPGKKAKVMA